MDPHRSPEFTRAISMLDEASRILRNVSSPPGDHSEPRTSNSTSIVPVATQGTSAGARGILLQGTPTGRSLQDGIGSLARFRQALPNGSAFSSGQSASTSSARQEHRNLFQPYPPTPVAPSGAPCRTSGARANPRIREWAHAFFCLGGPTDIRTPTSARKMVLQGVGLGSKVLRISANATGMELQTELRRLFALLGQNTFELLKSDGGGGGGKMLVQIGGLTEIPAPDDIMLLVGRALIYVRPIETIFDEDANISVNDASGADHANGNNLTTDGQLSDQSGAEPDANGNNLTTDEQLSEQSGAGSVDLTLGELVTIDDYRQQLYHENPGVQPIYIQRDNFAEAVIGVYKSPSFNLKLKPQIIFAGEAGTDVGALQKEYFWRGMLALKSGRLSGRLPFFEGEDNHKIPTCDGVLLSNDVFKAIGMFMAHGALHCGLSFVGMSQAVVDYLATGLVDNETPLTMTVDDIPEIETREVLKKVSDWSVGQFLNAEDFIKVEKLALECDFNEEVKQSNAAYLYHHVLHHIVIWRRKPQLDALKLGFERTGLTAFLKDKDYILGGLFPSVGTLLTDPSAVISKIQSEDGLSEHVDYVKEFISSQCTDSEKLGEIISAWTGWAILPDDNLSVKVIEEGEFCFHSCFQQLEIPSNFTKQDIFTHLARILEYGTSGFGAL